MQKALLIILGVLMCIGGVYCLAMPGLTYLSMAPLIAILMVINSIGDISTWNTLRKQGGSNPFLIISAVLSLILGIAMLFSFGMQLLFQALMTYMVSFWLIFTGICRIVAMVKLRKIGAAKSFGLNIVMGILMILVGIFGFINPISIAFALGIMIGISVISVGFSLISMAFAL